VQTIAVTLTFNFNWHVGWLPHADHTRDLACQSTFTSPHYPAILLPVSAMPDIATPTATTATVTRVCRHCCGSGREPAPLTLDLSRRGEQAQLARELGVSAATLCRVLAGGRAPGLLTLIRIARRYHTTVDRVLRIPAIWRRVHARVD